MFIPRLKVSVEFAKTDIVVAGVFQGFGTNQESSQNRLVERLEIHVEGSEGYGSGQHGVVEGKYFDVGAIQKCSQARIELVQLLRNGGFVLIEYPASNGRLFHAESALIRSPCQISADRLGWPAGLIFRPDRMPGFGEANRGNVKLELTARGLSLPCESG